MYNLISTNSTIPLSSFVGKFEVYHSAQGATGQWNPAGKGQLASDLGSENKDDALEIVLREGGKQMGDRLTKGLTKGKYGSTK